MGFVSSRMVLIAVLVMGSPLARSDEVRVDDFGAAGNGVANDDAAIKAAINAAGPHGTVVFTAGKTYTVRSRLVPLNGQTWKGNGATLRRADEIKTFLIADAQEGDNFLMVQNPAAYTIGMTVTPIRGPNGQADVEHAGNFAITAIDGNKLTLARMLTKSYSAGNPVVNYFDQVGGYTGIDRMEIDSLYFDGNRTNNDTLVVWSRNRAIATNSKARIANSFFANLPGDGIAALGENLLIEHNQFLDGNTAGIHLSGNFFDEDVVFRQNSLFRLNERAAQAGHSEGAITISQAANHVRLLQNLVFDTKTAFSGLFRGEMGDWDISHNNIADVDRLFLGESVGASPLHDIRWQENRAQDVGHSVLYTVAENHLIQRFEFVENRILDGSLELSNLNDSLVWGNTILGPGDSTLSVTNSFSTAVGDNVLTPVFANAHSPGDVGLRYHWHTGSLSLRGRLDSFALVVDRRRAVFNLNAVQFPFAANGSNTLALAFAIAQWDLDLQGLSGEISLGDILPSGMTQQQLQDAFLVAHYVDGNRAFGDMTIAAIPEPSGFGALAVVLGMLVVGRGIARSRLRRNLKINS